MLYQSLADKHVVNQLSVPLLRQFLWQFVLVVSTYQRVNHHLEYVVKVLGKQEILSLPVDGNLILPVEEGIAQVPYPESLVGEIFIFYLLQSAASEVLTNVSAFYLIVANQLIINVHVKREPMFLLYII